jgi:hypothetical protein
MNAAEGCGCDWSALSLSSSLSCIHEDFRKQYLLETTRKLNMLANGVGLQEHTDAHKSIDWCKHTIGTRIGSEFDSRCFSACHSSMTV